MSTSAASTSNEDDLRNQVLRDLDGDAETAPADAALFDALTDGERRAIMLALFLFARCPLVENAGHDCTDIVREALELVGHEPTVGRFAYQL